VLHKKDSNILAARRVRDSINAVDHIVGAMRGRLAAEELLLYVDNDDGNTGHGSLGDRWS